MWIIVNNERTTVILSCLLWGYWNSGRGRLNSSSRIRSHIEEGQKWVLKPCEVLESVIPVVEDTSWLLGLQLQVA